MGKTIFPGGIMSENFTKAELQSNQATQEHIEKVRLLLKTVCDLKGIN